MKDNIDHLFERFRGEFDIEEPQSGHRERFLEKLNQANGTVSINKKRPTWWKPLSIAASVALVALLGYQAFGPTLSLKEQVVEIAPEVSKTEFYFANVIEQQVQQLKDEKTPETAQLVDDTLAQLQRLQTRIDLLKEVLSQIENIKNLKSQKDESFII